MKHRGVKYVQVKWLAAIDIGKLENSPVKPVFGVGYSIANCNNPYPSTLAECKKSIDDLIASVMQSCGVTEKAAVSLLNEN